MLNTHKVQMVLTGPDPDAVLNPICGGYALCRRCRVEADIYLTSLKDGVTREVLIQSIRLSHGMSEEVADAYLREMAEAGIIQKGFAI
jgi:hypothetical protein